MKRTTVSLTVLTMLASAAGSSIAQSNVTIYGRVDLGMVVDSGNPAGKSVRLSSGVASADRLGFRGTDDLGDGYKASFQLETGFCGDSTAPVTSTLTVKNSSGATVGTTTQSVPNFCSGSNGFFGRQAHGDLSGPTGTLTAGRQYSLAFDDLIIIDPFATGYAGRINNIVDASGTRLNNAVRYTTPLFAGFRAAGEFAFGEVLGNAGAGREAGGAVQYIAGPAYASLSLYDQKNPNGDGDSRRNYQLGGTYDLQVVKLFALAQKGSGHPTGAAKVDTFDWMAGVNVPVAGGNLFGSFIHHDDRTSLNRDARQLAAGYNYPLSKRTSVYTAFGRIQNENGASFTLGNSTETGTGDKAFNFGVLHIF